MRCRIAAVGGLLASGLVFAATASASEDPLVVPPFVQTLIVERAPAYAYMPTRIADPGWRYSSFKAGAHGVSEVFRKKAGWQITFSAVPFAGDCRAGKQKSFQVDGNKAYWAQSGRLQQGWRCVVNSAGKQVKLIAATTQTNFADVGLGIVVASGRRIR